MENAQEGKRNDPLKEKSFGLAVRIVRLSKYLMEEKKAFVLSKQIMRCGTNPGAMVREAANAESGSDFIHKLSIAQKETGETQYWLDLLFATNYISQSEFDSLSKDVEEVMKLISKSIITKKKNMKLL
ncbi:MAG: four helix bundle protein [Bacteroidetes bacterium]|nr:four helix bundle protein [Bacteroidota bacterium]